MNETHDPFTNKRGKFARPQSALDWLAAFVATGFGVGMIPYAPGTFGSLVGVAIAYAVFVTHSRAPLMMLCGILLTCLVFTWLGFWASERAEKIMQRKDASQIVIDEIAGQLIAYVFVAPFWPLGDKLWWALIAGFALFRLFDIFKPYPINQLQSLTGGVGVMMDDIVAGLYAAIGVALLLGFLSH